MFKTINLGDVRLKIDPKISVHFFNNKSKFVFLREKVVILLEQKKRKCMRMLILYTFPESDDLFQKKIIV